jgi:hypothetical protein
METLELIVTPPAILVSSPHPPRTQHQTLTNLEVVLHDPRNQKIVVWDREISMLQVQSTAPRVCPFCHQSLPDDDAQWHSAWQHDSESETSYMSPHYFSLLQAHLQRQATRARSTSRERESLSLSLSLSSSDSSDVAQASHPFRSPALIAQPAPRPALPAIPSDTIPPLDLCETRGHVTHTLGVQGKTIDGAQLAHLPKHTHTHATPGIEGGINSVSTCNTMVLVSKYQKRAELVDDAVVASAAAESSTLPPIPRSPHRLPLLPAPLPSIHSTHSTRTTNTHTSAHRAPAVVDTGCVYSGGGGEESFRSRSCGSEGQGVGVMRNLPALLYHLLYHLRY